MKSFDSKKLAFQIKYDISNPTDILYYTLNRKSCNRILHYFSPNIFVNSAS